MSNRRITIKVKKEDLAKVIEEIRGEDIVSFTISMPDSKETYKYLSTNDKILDWEMEGEDVVEETEMPKPKKTGDDTLSDLVYDTITEEENMSLGIGNIIESGWKVSRKSPEIVPGTSLFMSSLERELRSLVPYQPTVEKAIFFKVIEAYYSGYKTEDIVSDLIDKMKSRWRELSKCETLTSVSILLFRT